MKKARKFCPGITASIVQRLSIGNETSTAAMNVAHTRSSAKSFLCGEKYEKNTLIDPAEKSVSIFIVERREKYIVYIGFLLRRRFFAVAERKNPLVFVEFSLVERVACRAEHFDVLVHIHLLELVARGAEILARVEFARILREELADGGRHRKPSV